eukprot:g6516.t1
MFKTLSVVVLGGVGLVKLMTRSWRHSSTGLKWNEMPLSVSTRIIEMLKESPDWKDDLSSLRQTSKSLRRFVNHSIAHLNTTRLAAIGGTLQNVSSFPFLTSLEIDFEAAIGQPETMPSVLSELRTLKSLTLSSFRLTPEVALMFQNLSNLRKLALNHVEIDSLSFLSEFTSLTELSLRFVDVTQPNLEVLTSMDNLEYFHLDHCDTLFSQNAHFISNNHHLKAVSIGVQIFNAIDIESLSLLNANLSLTIYQLDSIENFPSVCTLSNLKSLNLQSCDLESLQFPLTELQALRHLSLTTETVSAHDFTQLLTIRHQLESLSLELTNTYWVILDVICKADLPLVALSVRMGFVEITESLGLCVNLEALTIVGTNEQFASENLSCLRSLTKLKSLTLSNCADLTPILAVLLELGSNLHTLVIERSSLPQEELQKISQLPSLRSLSLFFCHDLASLNPLSSLLSLRVLALDCCVTLESTMQTELELNFLNRLDTLSWRLIDGSALEHHDELVAVVRRIAPHIHLET